MKGVNLVYCRKSGVINKPSQVWHKLKVFLKRLFDLKTITFYEYIFNICIGLEEY